MAEYQLTERDAPSWSSWVTDFDKSYKLFSDNYSGLLAVGSYVRSKHPEMLSQYNKLVSDAQTHMATLQRLKNVRDTVKGWLDNIGYVLSIPAKIGQAAAEGVEGAWDWIKKTVGLSALNALPLIAIGVSLAAAISALAVIGYWITDAYKFASKLNTMQRLEAQGRTPQEAANVVATLDTGGGLFGIPWTWIAVGAFGLFVLPRILERR